jgi:CubicO group peptidase (beta-lactamase class C family)
LGKGGLSKLRLERLSKVMAGHVERGAVPGLVTLVERRGDLEVEALGSHAVGGGAPMRRDTIFRITSMTKPVTAVAALILLEECKLRLDEPVDRLLPELANRRVLSRPDAEVEDTLPARRPITLRDLLAFTAGYGMVFGPNPLPIQKAIAELGIAGFGPPTPDTPHTPDEWLRKLSSLPLLHQPGESWLYGTGSYVLGALIARASGQSFERFLKQRIFEPLGMKDTGFSVPAEKHARLVPAYLGDAQGALQQMDGPGRDSVWSTPPALPDGGAGLVSTADDYLAFARMLQNGGRYGAERILSRPTVETMVSDQLTPEQKHGSGFPGFWDNHGWGFGVAVTTKRDGVSGSPGRYGWDGGYGTSWANDPAEDLTAILLTQRMIFPLESQVYLDFWTSVYQSIDD